MHIFIVGGTGLLGAAAAEEFLKRGHNVKTLALPGIPEGTILPEKMEITFGNYMEMSDEELLTQLEGCDCVVFAAGVDERVDFPAPVYPSYIKYNIEPVKRFLSLAKKQGAKKAVVLGSYFAYFNRMRPDLQLGKAHPYIRSRIEQEKVAMSFAGEGMDVAIMELPYIFGTQKGRRPVWTIFVQKILDMGPVTFWPKGGTALLTVRQVAESIVGAAEKNKGGNFYPVATENYDWKTLMAQVHIGMGLPKRKVVYIPECFFRLYGFGLQKITERKGVEPGLNYVELSKIMYSEVYIDTDIAKSLGVTDDDINGAIIDSLETAMDAKKHEEKYMRMKAE